MDWDNVKCYRCKSVNDYTIVEKSNNSCCYCNKCNNFLGNKPKNIPFEEAVLPFGKYSGEKIQKIYFDDKRYLEWLSKNVELKGSIRKAVDHFLGL